MVMQKSNKLSFVVLAIVLEVAWNHLECAQTHWMRIRKTAKILRLNEKSALPAV